MPCFKPIKAWLVADAQGKQKVYFGKRPSLAASNIRLPCNKCVGCRLERSRQWAVRCVHEAQLHEQNCFITLTYDDNNLPRDYSLSVQHHQKFIKRLRKALSPKKIRFFLAGEYGEKTFRPHYHALIFGYMPEDLVLYKNGNNPLYLSPKLQKIWGKGIVTVGNVTYESAAYTARYIMKKIDGDKRELIGENGLKHYEWLDDDGVIHEQIPEYIAMSRRPGIGNKWYELYKNDLYYHDHAISQGKKLKVPKYYDKLLDATNPQLLAQLKKDREVKAHKGFEHQTRERLDIRNELAKLNLQKRGL